MPSTGRVSLSPATREGPRLPGPFTLSRSAPGGGRTSTPEPLLSSLRSLRAPEAPILTTDSLAKDFKRNSWIIEAQTRDLTHQDSLLQVPGVNCLNWVLGHIANSRDEVLSLLGESPALGEAAARYRRESDPVTADGLGVVPLEGLLAVVAEGQERIEAALAVLPEESLQELRQNGDRTLPLGTLLHFAMWHETYHVGQTELLRALAGKRDKVI